ncbi:hypothetical protein ExPECSC057_02699 [Escherichia coli]|jgi:aminoglycoside phosphotransferase family enzyme|nr:hypothetical protein ExPECSC057_02699 [Escherichia coli]GCZ81635.1 hypothetical protein HmCmsJML183_00267 [Escherichia coli]
MKDNITAMTENIVRFFEQTSLREYIKKHGSTMKIASLLILNIRM